MKAFTISDVRDGGYNVVYHSFIDTRIPQRLVSLPHSSSPHLNSNGKTDGKTMAYIQASVRARENQCLAEEAEEKARVAREPGVAVR